ncbi:MAG: lysylphosphatidylglycerol synthase transmembrane domain-containing protein [Planctomycetota bacterium]|jgi:uncharacterized protein (TIRG00374 family)
MKSKTKRRALVAVGLVLSAVAVVYLLRGLRGSWGGLAQALTEANYVYVIPSVALLGLMYALRVVRWRLFLKPIKDVPYAAIASATCIGFMSSCILPLRPNEVIRPYVVHRKSGISFGDAAGTAVGLERVFDLIGLCFLLLVTWLLMGERSGGTDFLSSLADKGVLLAAVTAVGLIGLGVLAFRPSFVLKVAGFFLSFLPESWQKPLMEFVTAIANSMSFLKKPGQVAMALALSFAIWGLFPVSTYALSFAFDLDLSFLGALVVQVCVTAAVAVPQAPGFIGPFQWATMKAAELFGASQGRAGAFAMMLWAVHVVPITVVGLAVLRHEGLNLLRLAQDSKRAADQSE